MVYLNCERCGLEVKVQAAYLLDNCPRCLARSATVAPMAAGSRVKTRHAGRRPRAAGPHGDPDGPSQRPGQARRPGRHDS